MAATTDAGRRVPASAPGRFGAYLGVLIGVALAVLGVRLLFASNELPIALPVSLVLIGGVQVICAVFALRCVRVAWAFALSINGTAFVIFLFGAPKLRDAASLPIALALVPAVLFALVTTLYALSAEEY